MDALRRKSRTENAYDLLKTQILQNVMSPGRVETEPEIALRLGMSRTPVREALVRLENEGLLRLVPRRGVQVLSVSPDDMRDIYQLLTILEPEAAMAVARMAPDPAVLAPLQESIEQMAQALEDDDLDAWAEADDRFHRELLSLNPNRRLTGFVTTLFDQAHRARLITLRLRERPWRSTDDHRQILDAIARGDVEATRQLFRAHRERAANELLALLERARLSLL